MRATDQISGMSGPFLCYREIIPPTSVDAARFFGHKDSGDYLITLTSGAVNIYRVHSATADTETGAYLSLVLNTKVFGKPFDVNVFSSSTSPGYNSLRNDPVGCSYLIFNFDSGKITVARFDPCKNSLEIVSLYNAEEEAIGIGSEVHAVTQGRQISPGVGSTPYLVVDNEGSVACTLLYGQQFFFINLSTLSEHKKASDVSKKTATKQPHNSTSVIPKTGSSDKQFIVDIRLSLRLLGPILDYCFLPGYSRPVLAVLQVPTIH